MKSFFDESFFKNNRQKLRESLAQDIPIVITANGLLQRSGDTTFSFRQDSNFWYLAGLNEPDFVLVISTRNEFLITPPKSDYQMIMEASINLNHIQKSTGIKIYEAEEGWQQLTGLIKVRNRIATVKAYPNYIESHGLYTNPARHRLVSKLKKLNKNLKLDDIQKQLSVLRVIKQPQELVAINKAIDITSGAVKEVKERINSYQSEYEVEADITSIFKKQNSGHAFSPIIAAGKNAATIHYMANNSKIAKNDLLLLDIGAEVDNYAADISRTLVVTKPTRRQAAIYEAVRDVQQFAISHIRPGLSFKDYEMKIEKIWGIN